MSDKKSAWLLGASALATLGGYLYYQSSQLKQKQSQQQQKQLEQQERKQKLAQAVEYVSADSPVVVIDYNDLVNGVDISASIHTAFGFDGLGLITVKNVPTFVEKREKMLKIGQKFATLPEQVKDKYVHPASTFQFGWSHGKENLQGAPDYSKGSFYNNPVYNRPFDDEEIIRKYPTFAHPNIWPSEDMPEFEPAFLDLGTLIVDVGALLAEHLDRFIQAELPSYEKNRLTRVIRQGRNHKARLLHYFPFNEVKQPSEALNQEREEDFGSWCGWHNDHGSLTGLCSAMYLDAQGQPVQADSSSGLYIRTRKGEIIKAAFPANYLAFQMGETQQVHSGGRLRATPHCVRAGRGDNMRNVSRETFAVFMEPIWSEAMDVPAGTSAAEAQLGSSHQYLPKGVPSLDRRWDASMDFGQFTVKTLDAYTVY